MSATPPEPSDAPPGASVIASPVTIIGSYLSPYVRKVLVALNLKGVPFEIDPIVPFLGNDDFGRLSPLRRVPVYCDPQITLCDSTVICEYLQDSRPDGHPLYPRDVRARAEARWLEEFADTRMGEVFIWRLFNERSIRRAVWGEASDPTVIARTLEVDVPEVLAQLEARMPASGFLFGMIGVADIAIAAMFRNAALVRFEIDAARWPRTARLVDEALAHPAFASLRAFEDLSARTPIAGQRAALQAAGAPLTQASYAADAPRRGVMRI